jgi:carboxypeptidase C (cathepsin A)
LLPPSCLIDLHVSPPQSVTLACSPILSSPNLFLTYFLTSGASSLFACFTELGPYRLNSNLEPVTNPFSWNNEYNLVFLDNPRQTGYSYSDPGTLCTDWVCYGTDFDAFIRQFVSGFNLVDNQLYIFAESYGGHYNPASSFMILQNNAAGFQPFVNLVSICSPFDNITSSIFTFHLLNQLLSLAPPSCLILTYFFFILLL